VLFRSLEAAAALNEAGAKVQIAVRAPDVYFAGPPGEGPRSRSERGPSPGGPAK